ncbi:NAD(P)H-binding protein [Actinomadura roseirufa]|uniref:NAD(P)H-binding protein n=1 Tax=Actinomadura roseirufa TaxID=2094049 RepID=UPI00104129BF|nr:NAD(P)H-binding protein [Actinomadura roseirufa]
MGGRASHVLVTGGTGKTGGRVAALLREEGVRARVATRRPEGSGQVRFDWFAPATHGPALAGVDAVYLVPPVGVAEPAPVVAPFLDEAVRAGVRRVVLLGSSAISAGGSGSGALYGLVREAVAEWTVLRPSWFMQNFLGAHPVAEGIRRSGEIVTATGTGRVAFVDVADIAAVAVRVLLDAVPHDTEYIVTGPEALGYADAAAVVAAATGLAVRHRPVGAAELAARFAAAGLPADYAAVLAGLDEGIARGSEDRVTTTVEAITGRPPRSFAAFVAAHRDAFIG